jgi:hypothetical protein
MLSTNLQLTLQELPLLKMYRGALIRANNLHGIESGVDGNFGLGIRSKITSSWHSLGTSHTA